MKEQAMIVEEQGIGFRTGVRFPSAPSLVVRRGSPSRRMPYHQADTTNRVRTGMCLLHFLFIPCGTKCPRSERAWIRVCPAGIPCGTKCPRSERAWIKDNSQSYGKEVYPWA